MSHELCSNSQDKIDSNYHGLEYRHKSALRKNILLNRMLQFVTINILIFLVIGCSKYGKIEGVIHDKLSEKPIAGAKVMVKGTNLIATTDSSGHFFIKGVVPGTQKLVAEKEGYLSIGETDLTVAKGTTVESSVLYLVPKPAHIGLFSVEDKLMPITRVPERSFEMAWGGQNKILEASKSPAVITINKRINMIFYEGDSPSKTVDLAILKMKYYPASQSQIGFFAIPSPDRWVTQEPVTQGIQIDKLSSGLSLIKGELPTGRYCFRVQHVLGVEDWFFVFDVK